MELGTFSVSLAVKDLAASRDFYEKLGFTQTGGEESQNWLILANGGATIGLFQGMFEKNLLTFNPKWSAAFTEDPEGTDVRDIQKALVAAGVTPVVTADETTSGPAHIALEDPDGNQILLDQHV